MIRIIITTLALACSANAAILTRVDLTNATSADIGDTIIDNGTTLVGTDIAGSIYGYFRDGTTDVAYFSNSGSLYAFNINLDLAFIIGSATASTGNNSGVDLSSSLYGHFFNGSDFAYFDDGAGNVGVLSVNSGNADLVAGFQTLGTSGTQNGTEFSGSLIGHHFTDDDIGYIIDSNDAVSFINMNTGATGTIGTPASTLGLANNFVGIHFDGSNDFALAVVPEPSSFALLLGLCGIVSILLRRKRA
ncbi:MAG: PEP-CTERM sorting domain-containing protein [Verrucomicrobiota bacterium]